MNDVIKYKTEEVKISKLGDPKHIHSYEHIHEHEHDGHKHSHLHQHSQSYNHHPIVEDHFQEHFNKIKP